jgi:hypothetical protein
MVNVDSQVWSAGQALIVAFLGGGASGYLLHRWKERVTWQEAARGELAKLRYDAFVKSLRSVSELVHWKSLSGNPKAAERTAQLIDVEMLKARIRDAELTLIANLLLLPRHLRKEFGVLSDALAGQQLPPTAELEKITRTFADAIETYLPRLERRDLEPDERAAAFYPPT